MRGQDDNQSLERLISHQWQSDANFLGNLLMCLPPCHIAIICIFIVVY